MQGVGKALASHLGETQCQLLPCPGWDCGALFPAATLRLEGTWFVFKPPPPRAQHPACAAATAPLPSCSRQNRPVSARPPRSECVAPPAVGHRPHFPGPSPVFRLAGDSAAAPVLLIAHLLSGGAHRPELHVLS